MDGKKCGVRNNTVEGGNVNWGMSHSSIKARAPK